MTDGEAVRRTISGVELVTIPVSYFAELLDCQRRIREAGGMHHLQPHPAQMAVDPRSRLFGDPEVAVYLYELVGRSKLKDAYFACVERFGSARAPSRATIARFWKRLRD